MRGQTAVEFVFAAALVIAVAVLAVPLVTIWRDRVRAERIADQAAVLVAEGRPLPAVLSRGVRIDVTGGAVRVAVPADVLGRRIQVAATARVR
jgi:hypothetical protein